MRDTFSAVRRLISRQPIASFLFLAYVWSWLFWVPSVLLYRRGSMSFPVWALTIGAYGPTIAALLVTIVVAGGYGSKALLRKYLVWRVGIWWYGAAAPVTPAAVGIYLMLVTGLSVLIAWVWRPA